MVLLKIIKLELKKIKNTDDIDYRNPSELCLIKDVLPMASDKWSILIVLYLGCFPVLRFNKLKKYVYGISSKVLNECLRMLEVDGYLNRKMNPSR